MPEDNSVENAYREFREELLRDAEFSGEPQRAAFFQLFAELAAENGDTADLIYAPVFREGTRGYQVDGYAWDAERGELHVAVCDYHADEDLQTINMDRPTQLFGRVRRFLQQSVSHEFLDSLEETSPAFELANLVNQAGGQIKRIRCVIFSNARLSTRKKTLEAEEVNGAKMTLNIIDFVRYLDIASARGGTEPIELEVRELNDGLLPCLDAHDPGSDVQSYLVVMPGELLARIYGLYGARLMEQNVRTFLQARTKTNKGIIHTASDQPARFFAYNNGITATANGVVIEKDENGRPGISQIRNLQIVNGGQTTASLLYAGDRGSADLSKVFVQMKLTVIDPEQVDTVVPLISRYANTQNKVSEADFFSNHEFHVEMQKISRRLAAPAAAGSLATTKWFYERARGQYRTECGLRTPSEKRRFQVEYPRSQVIQKTDLAKYQMSFRPAPHVVSTGAQKCFLEFAKEVDKQWQTSRTTFNDAFFREMAAQAIIFRWVDKHVGTSDWYKEDRGYKANIVTYTIGWLVHHLSQKGQKLDLEQVWKEQDVPDELQAAFADLAPKVARVVKSPPPSISNISEYAKKDVCWKAVRESDFDFVAKLKASTISAEEVRQRKKDNRLEGEIDLEIGFDTLVLENMARICDLEDFAKRKRLMTPSAASAIRKLRNGRIDLSRSDKKGLKQLLGKLDEFGTGPRAWAREKEHA